MNVKEFAARLKAERARLNLTQAECAEYLGVDVRTINGWENGARPSGLTQAGVFAKLSSAKPVAAK